MNKKPKIDKKQYLKLQNAVHSLLLDLPEGAELEVDNETKCRYNIKNLPTNPYDRVIYVDSRFQHLFEPYKTNIVRTCKVVNFGRPAMKANFSEKHKYYVKKNPSLEEVILILKNLIQKIDMDLEEAAKAELEALKAGTKLDLSSEKKLLIEQRKEFVSILNHPNEYVFAESSYYNWYHYTVVSFLYFDPKTGKRKSGNEHIIRGSSREAMAPDAIKKMNVFFVDVKRTVAFRGKSDKEVVDFLNQFSHSIDLGRTSFYYRRKEVEQEATS